MTPIDLTDPVALLIASHDALTGELVDRELALLVAEIPDHDVAGRFSRLRA